MNLFSTSLVGKIIFRNSDYLINNKNLIIWNYNKVYSNYIKVIKEKFMKILMDMFITFFKIGAFAFRGRICNASNNPKRSC